jgi:hypothetical protein
MKDLRATEQHSDQREYFSEKVALLATVLSPEELNQFRLPSRFHLLTTVNRGGGAGSLSIGHGSASGSSPYSSCLPLENQAMC